MRKTLLTYVKPHVQEDPPSMILGITYLERCMEKEKLPVELCDERIVNDAYMREAIERNDIIGFDALTPNIRRAIASGYFMQVAHLDGTGKSYVTVKDLQAVHMHPSCTLDRRTEGVIYHGLVMNSRNFNRKFRRLGVQ